MQKFKDLLLFLIFTAFFAFLTGVMIDSYLEEYNLSAAKSEEAIVIDKVSKKSLFTPPSYFVRVQLTDGTESEYLHRISKKQIENLQLGEAVQGFSIYRTFSTTRDLLYDSFFYLLAISIFGFLTIIGIFVCLTEIPAIDRLVNKTFLGKPSKGKGMKFLSIVMVLFTIVSGRFLLNVIRKIMPFSKTTTEATIIGQDLDIQIRRRSDPNFEFTLTFENQENETIEVIKEVTRHTYKQYHVGDTLEVAYRQSNPYDLFVNNTTSADIVQAFTYNECLAYVGILAVMTFTAFVLIKRRQKKKQSHEIDSKSKSL